VPAIKAGAKRVAPAGIAFPENARLFVPQYYEYFLFRNECEDKKNNPKTQ